MYTGLHHLHSSFRYIILIILVITIAKAWVGWKNKKPYNKSDNLLSLLSMIFLHTQFLIGCFLYWMSPKVQLQNMAETMKEPLFRFFTVEHTSMMLIAIILITVGRSLSKRTSDDVQKHKKTALYFLVGLLIIFMSIPWPFLKDFGSWF